MAKCINVLHGYSLNFGDLTDQQIVDILTENFDLSNFISFKDKNLFAEEAYLNRLLTYTSNIPGVKVEQIDPATQQRTRIERQVAAPQQAAPVPQSPIYIGNIPNQNINNSIKFEEEKSYGYKERTQKNASADGTMHLGVNFNTPGEILTKKSVIDQKKLYMKLDVSQGLEFTPKLVERLVEAFNDQNIKTLNIAGNGIYDMVNYTQEQVDEFTYQLLKAIVESPNLKNKIDLVRSGGQTGFDEAGVKAARRLGIPSLVLAPKGWLFRVRANNKRGYEDISNEQQFKQRFNNITTVTSQSITQQQAQPTTKINFLKLGEFEYAKDGNGRYFVAVNIKGAPVLFYTSSEGTSGKELGKWYPIVGVSQTGYIIKGALDLETPYNIDQGYGIKEIKEAQDELNSNYKLDDLIKSGYFNNKKVLLDPTWEINQLIGLPKLTPDGSGYRVMHAKSKNMKNVIDRIEAIDKWKQWILNKQAQTSPVTQTQQPTQAGEIYNQLGNKTKTRLVSIKPWSELKDAKLAVTNEGIISTRINSNEHFGNPFSSDQKVLAQNKSLIPVASTKDAVIRYIDWVISSQDDRAKWIRSQINSGQLKNKPIFYYSELGEPSHATALSWLINSPDSPFNQQTQLTQTSQQQTSPQSDLQQVDEITPAMLEMQDKGEAVVLGESKIKQYGKVNNIIGLEILLQANENLKESINKFAENLVEQAKKNEVLKNQITSDITGLSEENMTIYFANKYFDSLQNIDSVTERLKDLKEILRTSYGLEVSDLIQDIKEIREGFEEELKILGFEKTFLNGLDKSTLDSVMEAVDNYIAKNKPTQQQTTSFNNPFNSEDEFLDWLNTPDAYVSSETYPQYKWIKDNISKFKGKPIYFTPGNEKHAETINRLINGENVASEEVQTSENQVVVGGETSQVTVIDLNTTVPPDVPIGFFYNNLSYTVNNVNNNVVFVAAPRNSELSWNDIVSRYSISKEKYIEDYQKYKVESKKDQQTKKEEVVNKENEYWNNNENNIVNRRFQFNVGTNEKGVPYNHRVHIEKLHLLDNGNYHIMARNTVNGNNYDMVVKPTGEVVSYTRNGKTFSAQINDEIVFSASDYAKPKNLYFQIATEPALKLYDSIINLYQKLDRLPTDEWLMKYVFPSNIDQILDELGADDTAKVLLKEHFFNNKELIYSSPNIYEVLSSFSAVKRINEKSEPAKKADQELDKKLMEFLAPLNINIRDISEIKDRLGVNAIGVADIINKLIYVAEDRQIDTLPEEVAHFYVELLERRNKIGEERNYLLYRDLMSKIEGWEKYKQYYEQYSKVYVDEKGQPHHDKIKKEIIGKAIAEAIVRKFETKDKGLMSTIQQAIDFLKSLFKRRELFPIDVLVDDIAEKILNKDYSDISKDLKPGETLKDYFDLPQDTRRLVKNLSSLGAHLTGSVPLRLQGSIYRTKDEEFHDFDFKVPPDVNREDFIAKVKEMYPTLTLKSEFESAGAYTTLWTLEHEGKVYDIDFFFQPKDYNRENQFNYVHWYDTFVAKLAIGRSKDIKDFINFKPYERIWEDEPSIQDPEYMYYQTEESVSQGLNSQKEFITENDRIIWGHPAIGKTTVLESNPNAFIDWDDEFNSKRDKWIENKTGTVKKTPGFKQAKNEILINYKKYPDFIEFITNEWNRVKEKARQENKILLASPSMLIDLFEEDFDKIINMSDETFIKRNVDRNAGNYEESKSWKEGINTIISNVKDKSKIITTDKYIGELLPKQLTPQQRQNIQELKQLEPAYQEGTDEQVQEFIESIYPESVLKNIIWHGTNAKFDKFEISKIGLRKYNKQGIFFGRIPEVAGMYGKNILSSIINVINPEITENEDTAYKGIKTNENADSIFWVDDVTKNIEIYVVFEPEQITILNSPETIKRWQEFLANKNNKQQEQQIINSLQDASNRLNTLGFKAEIKKDKYGRDDLYIWHPNSNETEYVRVTKNQEDGEYTIHKGDLLNMSTQDRIELLKAQSDSIPEGGAIVNHGKTSYDGLRSRLNLKKHGWVVLPNQTHNQGFKPGVTVEQIKELAKLHGLGEVLQNNTDFVLEGGIQPGDYYIKGLRLIRTRDLEKEEKTIINSLPETVQIDITYDPNPNEAYRDILYTYLDQTSRRFKEDFEFEQGGGNQLYSVVGDKLAMNPRFDSTKIKDLSLSSVVIPAIDKFLVPQPDLSFVRQFEVFKGEGRAAELAALSNILQDLNRYPQEVQQQIQDLIQPYEQLYQSTTGESLSGTLIQKAERDALYAELVEKVKPQLTITTDTMRRLDLIKETRCL